MKIEAYEQMISELRKENETLQHRVAIVERQYEYEHDRNNQYKKQVKLYKLENEELKNQLLSLQKTSAEVLHQNKIILTDSKEIQASFIELKKIYNELYGKYKNVKECYNRLVDAETIHVKARDFYSFYDVKSNKYYLFLNFENETQTQIEITRDFYLRIHDAE